MVYLVARSAYPVVDPPETNGFLQWQRIALARAFMRASEPGIDMFLFDEPVSPSASHCCLLLNLSDQTSALDAHAQSQIFDTVEKISRTPSGERTKTVIFITHRLSTARRADKVAMMENGVSIWTF
jgi:ABC-type multidrug transport system fused ATPase/permease subunit